MSKLLLSILGAVKSAGLYLTDKSSLIPSRTNTYWGPETVNSIVWTGSAFVAVGRRARVASSSDGSTWTHLPGLGNTFGLETEIKHLVWSGSSLVGYNGTTAYVSTDAGASWTRYTASVPFSVTCAHAVGSTIWVAGNASVARSSNGYSGWTNCTTALQASGWTNSVTTHIASNGSVVLLHGVYAGGLARSSDNGVTWTNSNPYYPSLTSAVILTSLVWSSALSKFYALVDFQVIESTDGATWSSASYPPGYPTFLSLVGSYLVSLDATDNSLSYSDNGYDWDSTSVTFSPFAPVVTASAFSSSTLLVASQPDTLTGIETSRLQASGSTFTGSNVTHLSASGWASAVLEGYSGPNLRVHWTGTYLVAAGPLGLLSTSSDGSTWTYQSDLAATSWYNADVYAIASNSSVLVISGALGNLAYSTNSGISWTVTSSPNGTAYCLVHLSGSTFVGGTDEGFIRTTDSGASWSSVSFPSGFTGTVQSLAYSGSALLAVSSNGCAATSTDGGASWVNRPALSTALSSASATCAVWTGSYFVVGGASSRAARSTDGAVWTSLGQIPFYVGTEWAVTTLSLSYNGTYVLATGNAGNVIAYSADHGQTWSAPSLASSVGVSLSDAVGTAKGTSFVVFMNQMSKVPYLAEATIS